MEPTLFDIQDGRVVPTEHCYTIAAYRNVIDEYGSNAGKIFALCHYMYSLNEKRNPFANIPEDQKEEVIIRQLCPELDTDNQIVKEALELTKKAYETPVQQAFKGFKVNMEKLGKFLETEEWRTGKDGNVQEIIALAKNYPAMRLAYKQAYTEYQEEQGNSSGIGGTETAYDEDDNDDDD